MESNTKNYSQEDLDSLLEAVYRVVKWQTYDCITEDSVIWDFISELHTEASYLDPDRYAKAQQEGIREALNDGARPEDVEQAGYELPPELQEEPKHA